jgi:nitrous oxidase accessory protein NosD
MSRRAVAAGALLTGLLAGSSLLIAQTAAGVDAPSASSTATATVATGLTNSTVVAIATDSTADGTAAIAATATDAPTDSATADGSTLASTYPGDPDTEAALVAAEERRLVEVRSIANGARWTGASQSKPFRLETGNTYTLVLVARKAAYTLSDLIELAPQTLVRQPDGSYLLGENIVVEEGATLNLTSSAGLHLYMSSSDAGFVSIVTLGGDLVVAGTDDDPTVMSSWDPTTGQTDTDTTDGRAYVRVVGGHADIQHAQFDHLGFWSGTTGGFSMTGTELPDVTAADDQATKPVDGAATTAAPTGAVAAGQVPSAASGSAAAVPTAEVTQDAPQVFGKDLLPTDAGAQTLALMPDMSGYSYVSARVLDATFSENAFGLFITNAKGVVISDSRIENSLVDGLVMHRDVSASSVTRTVSTGNAVDGFRLARATSGIVLTQLTATDNEHNGISVEGEPLADGPSATGTAVAAYGNNKVSDSTVDDNGRYGIDVVGGVNITLDGNSLSGDTTGIVVSNGASAVTVKDNTIDDFVSQGIALREAGTDLVVDGNAVTGGEVGIYVRNAGGSFENNTVEDVSNHALTLIGDTGASTISDNTLSGRGRSAIDVARTSGTQVTGNDVDNWDSTKPLSTVLRQIFQPLTVVWMLLALLVVMTAFTSLRHRSAGVRHPYANRVPLSQLTRGVVSPEEALRACEGAHQPILSLYSHAQHAKVPGPGKDNEESSDASATQMPHGAPSVHVMAEEVS